MNSFIYQFDFQQNHFDSIFFLLKVFSFEIELKPKIVHHTIDGVRFEIRINVNANQSITWSHRETRRKENRTNFNCDTRYRVLVRVTFGCVCAMTKTVSQNILLSFDVIISYTHSLASQTARPTLITVHTQSQPLIRL